MEENEVVTCGCCGRGLRNNAEENVHYGMEPYPDDEGFGMCVECGGDKKATGADEASLRKRIGAAGEMFYDARIDVLNETLKGDSLAKFTAMSYGRKIVIIGRLIERGAMI